MFSPVLPELPGGSIAARLELRRVTSTTGEDEYVLRVVGWVESPLVDPHAAPKQGDEGAPEAWIVFDPVVLDAVRDLRAGADAIVLTWLHRARRDLLTVHPRDDPRKQKLGVFSTRSADRPNPIGLHRVGIVAVHGNRVLVRDLEAIDGTPVLDIKPLLESDTTLR